MKSFKHLILVSLTAFSICQDAAAQQVYRCGSSYSQTPCAGAVAVQTDDPRTDSQRAAAKEAQARDKALATEMEATRRKDEAIVFARDNSNRGNSAKKLEAKKPEEKKAADKKSTGTRKVKVKAKEPEFFTATDGAGKAAKKIPKSKRSTP